MNLCTYVRSAVDQCFHLIILLLQKKYFQNVLRHQPLKLKFIHRAK